MRMGRITNVYDVEPVADASPLVALLTGALPEVASIDTSCGPLRIVSDPTIPEDTIEMRHPDGRVARVVNVGR